MLNLWLKALLPHCISYDISVIELYNCYDSHVGTVYRLLICRFENKWVEPQYDLDWMNDSEYHSEYHSGKSGSLPDFHPGPLCASGEWPSWTQYRLGKGSAV